MISLFTFCSTCICTLKDIITRKSTCTSNLLVFMLHCNGNPTFESILQAFQDRQECQLMPQAQKSLQIR